MKITVKKEHIARGRRANSKTCAVALAIKEASPCDVYVHSATCVVYRAGNRMSSALPRSAKRFIERFDLGKPVKPFTFTLKI